MTVTLVGLFIAVVGLFVGQIGLHLRVSELERKLTLVAMRRD